ncbi:rRNA maturation RNase YbeY [Furfurilactobacillus entadae]|uniref:rRNA maturation RNase YbeY n=1 Tax=Furfurilactobacillus entadae TaxID=2922307 RepID=UPI0035EA393C
MDLEIFDQTEAGVPEAQLTLIRGVLEKASQEIDLPENTEMSVTLMNNDAMRKLNNEYRGVDKPTDVISFAIEEDPDDEDAIIMDDELRAEIPLNIGDIMISVDKVGTQAEYLGHSYERELGFLTIHGFLHLNGFDHMEPEDEKKMFDLQRKILDDYGLTR